MLKKEQKKQIVDTLVKNLDNKKVSIFVNAEGLKVKDAESLRKEFFKKNIGFIVAKKTLLSLALSKHGVDVDLKPVRGLLGIAFGYEDEVTPAKIINDFSKKIEAIKIFGGLIGDNFITGSQVKTVASLPDKDSMRALTIGTIQAPISSFVRVLQGNARNLVYILNQIATSKS